MILSVILVLVIVAISFARNLGLKQATGEYILFIDGDDMLFDDILPLWMENIYRNRLDVSFVGYEERYWGEDHGFKENRNDLEGVYTGEEILIKKLKKQIWICTGNAIYRAEILRKNNIEYNISCRVWRRCRVYRKMFTLFYKVRKYE